MGDVELNVTLAAGYTGSDRGSARSSLNQFGILGGCTAPAPQISLSPHDRIAQSADILDLNLDRIAGLQINRRLSGNADAGGRSGENQVAWLQVANARDVSDELVDRKDEL